MAYEPTKNFRDTVRALVPGDEIVAVGSYKKGSINLEKMCLVSPARDLRITAPQCTACNKRMTSDGKGKGFKCRKCGAHAMDPEVQEISRMLTARLVQGTADRPQAPRKTAVQRGAGDPVIFLKHTRSRDQGSGL